VNAAPGFAAIALALALASCDGPASKPVPESPPAPPERADPPLELFAWERGIGIRAVGPEPMPMYLWFYEWSLFDGPEPGEWTEARHDHPVTISDDARTARIDAGALTLDARVVADGVELDLAVDNRTGRAWPDSASLIACFNPGPKESRTFEMGHHLKTYLLAKDGLERFQDRDMHFVASEKPALQRRSPDLGFAFSDRWPTSSLDTQAGLLLRESFSGGWTSGVAWSSATAVQAHNPWLCMHVATKLGPLAVGERKTLRGMLYLFPGDRHEGLRRYQRDFPR
jgi:hypothetical protein